MITSKIKHSQKKSWKFIQYGELDWHCHSGEKIQGEAARFERITKHSRFGCSIMKWEKKILGNKTSFVPCLLAQDFSHTSDTRLEDREISFMMVASSKPTSFPSAPSPRFSPARRQEAPMQHRFVAGNRLELIPSWGCLFLLKYFPPLQLARFPLCESIWQFKPTEILLFSPSKCRLNATFNIMSPRGEKFTVKMNTP